MKYFIDTEFFNYKKQPKVLGLKVGKPIDTIELISIGIVSESIGCSRDTDKDGNCDIHPSGCNQKEYYAISKDFDLKAAWKDEWLKQHILKPIFWELYNKEYAFSRVFNISNLKKLINKYGKTKKQITEEIKEFTNIIEREYPTKCECQERSTCYKCEEVSEFNKNLDDNVEFYGWFSEPDYIVFRQLFENLGNYPKEFPNHFIDLQIEVDKCSKDIVFPKELRKVDKNSLVEAKWNYELYKFLKTL